MRSLLLALVLAFALVPGPAAAEGGKKADLEGIAKTVAAFLKKKELGKKDPEEIGKKIAPLGEEDLASLRTKPELLPTTK